MRHEIARSARIRRLSRVVLMAGLAVSPRARAATGPEDAVAQEKLKAGTQAFRAGLYDIALDEFVAAQAMRPSPRIEFNVAETLVLLKREPEAADAFEAFLEDAPTEQADFRAEAQLRLAALSGRTLAVDLPCAPPTYTLVVDGLRRTLPHPRDRFRVIPGPHDVSVAGVDLRPLANERVEAGRGQRVTVSLCVPPGLDSAETRSGAVTSARDAGQSWWTRPRIAAAVGLVVLLAAAVVVTISVARSDPPSSSLGNYPL